MDSEINLIKKTFKIYLKAKNLKSSNNQQLSLSYFKNILSIVNKLNPDKIPQKYKAMVEEIAIISYQKITELETSSVEYIHETILNNSISSDIEEPNVIFNILETEDINKLERWLENKGNINWDVYNDTGDTPLHVAVINGDTNIVELILNHGANINLLNKVGYTSLEISCIDKNPNMIKFLENNGANFKKHLTLRDKCKGIKLDTQDIDLAILVKYITVNLPYTNNWNNYWIECNNKFNIMDNNSLTNVFENAIWECKIGWNEYTWGQLFEAITKHINEGIFNNYPDIIKICLEEFQEIDTKDIITCPKNNLHNCLYSMLPFINLDLKINSEWLINYEIVNLICQIRKKHLNKNDFLEEFLSKIWIDYVDSDILTPAYLSRIINKWIDTI